ncbi:Carboxylesterase [Necator americanus]|uniref:Carboxylesterase n=1 Tax=Necator americanus TaxID=51031 RepID=W2TI42_NECAM|nr:Carboxylesterase [Necator americanus]ETN81493.1 Carboxylesterase [Necator americanus]
MNIWVPEKHNGSVMVWIFGGGFFSGSPSLDLYNGTALAVLKETIVVNINYRVFLEYFRLGPFGFLYLGEMSSAPGNMGLLDQQVALQWVHKHISSFGGDPSKVTLFGESAGSASVTAHLAAPYSYPYFSRIIGNSGSIMNSWATKTPEAMFNLSMKLAERVNCTKKGFDEDAVHLCLTSLPASVIQKAADEVTSETSLPMTFGFVPISADRNFFKGNVFDRLRNGNIKKNVDVILGTVKDEGTYWLPYYLSEYGFSFNHTLPPNGRRNKAMITRTQYRKSVQTFMPYFGESPLVENALLYTYENVSNRADMELNLRDGVGRFIGDYFFTCDVIDFADVISRIIKGPVYMYYLTMRSSANPWPKWMGVMHGYEIEYEFGQPILRPELYDQTRLKTERSFSKYVMRLWMNFANTGNPEKRWPKYNVKGRKTLVLGEKSTNGTPKIIFDVDGPNCRLLEEAKSYAGNGTMQILTVLPTALFAAVVAGNTINTTTLFSKNTVITDLGKIQGVAQIFDGKRVTAFLGVPYARPPINKRRFTEPVMIRPWAGVLDATKPSPACYLTMDATFPNFTGAEMWNPQNGITEDCLKMNIWVPEKHNGSVMVWIFGGGFFSGSPSLDLYNGTALAVLKETIVVNINYRYGHYLALPFHDKNTVGDTCSPIGSSSVKVTMKFMQMQRNSLNAMVIGSFGGDPSKVTLFGESAGSASVTAHLAAPYSYPYFSRIIGNSGSIMNSWATKTPEAMFNLSMKLAERVNCTKKGFDEDAVHLCLTSLPASVIQEAADNVTYETSLPMTFGFVPISADRNFFKGDVFDRLRDGKIKKDVDVILGTVKDEGTYWLPYYLSEYGFSFNHTLPANDTRNEALITRPYFRTQYRKSIQTFIPYFEGSALVENALLYRYQNFSNNATIKLNLRDGVGRFIGDYFFTCSVIDFADIISRIINGHLYMYYLTMRSSANPWPKWMGVMHGYEIEYEFGQPFLRPELYDKDYLETEQRFSKYVIRLWMNFANTGVPGKSWPKYDVNGRKTLVLGEKSTNRTRDIIFDVDGPNCRLLEEAKAHAGHGFTLKKYIERKLKKQKT